MINRQERHIYRLDGVEIDTAQACLTRNGEEQHLRQKTFQVLIYLLEQRPRLIMKGELIDHIWRDTAVTDNALEQCLAEIRKVLGDDSRHPRFIKTVPRAGYRFIGTVEETSAALPIVEEPAAPTNTNVESSRSIGDVPAAETALARLKPTQWIAPRWVAIWLSVVVVALFASAFYLIRRRSTSESLVSVTLPQDAGKRPVAVMFFDNQSSSADLEWLREGLADMLITDLSRSRNLTVLSRQQLRVLLERTGHRESEKIRLDEALDLAQKSQARIVILGSFARLGEQIRIDAELHDARDGQLLAAERLIVDQPGQILTQVDLLSLKLASHLGAAPEQRANAGLTSVMTNNLQAYRYYSLGVEKAQALRNPEAIELLKKAIALDPEFAMSYARIGYAYGVSGTEPEKAKPYLQKGFQLSDRLTERDKLYIAAWNSIVNLDYPAAINYFRDLISQYPLDVEAYWRLSRLLNGERRYEEALEIAKQGLVIDSGGKDLYNALGITYSNLGRHDEAINMFQRYVELAPEEPNAHDSLGLGFQWAGRYAEAIAEYERALALKRDFAVAIIHLGNTYFQLGRYGEAIRQYQSLLLSPSDLDPARAWHSLSVIYRRQEKMADAARAARKETNYHREGVAGLFMVALEQRDKVAAERFEQIIETRFDADRGARAYLRQLFFYRGYLDLRSGRGEKAIENFKQALNYRPLIWDVDALEDCLANAYLELGRPDEAIAEYQRILRLNPNYQLIHYHLAQAYERKGSRDQARREYDLFLQVWKEADADIPEVISARKALSG